jgi:hypothetical protein
VGSLKALNVNAMLAASFSFNGTDASKFSIISRSFDEYMINCSYYSHSCAFVKPSLRIRGKIAERRQPSRPKIYWLAR